MEKPPLEKVIETLEKLDIHEWSISGYSLKKPVLTVKTNGLAFYIKIYEKVGIPFDKTCYSIILQDENQKVFIKYEEDTKKEKINKFYEGLCEKLQEFKKDELNKRIQDSIYGLESGKKDIEKIIEKLESIDIKEWETNLCFYERRYEPTHPEFTINIYGLRFSIKKEFFRSYILEIENLEKDTKTVYGQKVYGQKNDFEKRLIKHLYEKLYKELENKEKGFKEKLDNFLLD